MTAETARREARALLRSSLRGRRRQVRGLALWSTVEAVPAFLSGRLVAEAIDDGFLAGRTSTGLAWLGVLAVAVVLGAWATRQTFLRLSAVVEPFRDELVRRAVSAALRRSTLPGAPADTPAVARVTQQVEIVREAYASVLMVVQGFLVVSVGALLGLLSLAPEILVLVVPPLALGLALFAVALPRMAARQRDAILAEERIARDAGAVAQGMRDVVACGAEEVAARRVGQHVDAHADATRALARLTAVRTLAVAVGGLAPLILILAASPWLVDRGATAGTILGALTYVAGGLQPALQSLVRGLAGPGLWLFVTLRRVVEASELPAQPAAAGADRPSPPAEGTDATVKLTGVRFAYGPGAEPVIDDLHLVVAPGEHLAVVGPSGIGKSTLAGLITGVLTAQAGDVRVGGVPIERIEPQVLAGLRVLIPQEAYVFAGTLGENLAYLRPAATEAELAATVDALGMRALVQRLGGFEAMLDAGALSAGERQLVTLARAYLSPARLAVLDEATCHLDPAAEARVERAFARRPGTLIVVAHRISSALRAERVLVLDGTQFTVDTPERLVGQSALYRDLVGEWQAAAGVGSRA